MWVAKCGLEAGMDEAAEWEWQTEVSRPMIETKEVMRVEKVLL